MARRTASLSPRALDKALESGRIDPLYILEGGDRKGETDRISLGRCVERIRRAVLPGGDDDWNLTVIATDRPALSEILDAALTFPLLGGQRLVLVRGATDIVTAKDEAGQKEQIETLRRIGEGGEGSSVLVLVEPPLDGRLKVHKALVENATIVSCAAPAPQEMPGWIEHESRDAGLSLAPGAAETLAAIVGSDTLRARQEIEKLSLYLSGEKSPRRVTAEDVGTLAAGGALADAWRLCDAVASLDESEALRLARELTDAGEEPIALLGALAFRVRQMIQAGEAVREKVSIASIAGRLRLWGGTRQAIETNARRYAPGPLAGCLQRLHRADRAMKSGSDPREVLLSTVSTVIRAARGRQGL